MAFLAFKVAFKVNDDLEFEIGGLCSLCKPILSYLYSCFGHFWHNSEINSQKIATCRPAAAGKNVKNRAGTAPTASAAPVEPAAPPPPPSATTAGWPAHPPPPPPKQVRKGEFEYIPELLVRGQERGQ